MMVLVDMIVAGCGGSVTAESLESKQFQPVWMPLAGQQLSRAASNTFATFTSFKTAVIKKESQQIQVIIAYMPAKEEVVSQTAV